MSVEAEVPESLSAESWREVLEVVAEADRFGLLATTLNGRALWAVVRKAVPSTGDVGGPSHQRWELSSMLNRIRRAASLTRERHFPKGRHRRPLTPTRPTPAYAPPAPTDGPTAVPGRGSHRPNHAGSLAGEDIELVRPYVLAWEKRVRPRRSTIEASHLPAEVWPPLAGVR